MIILNVTYKCMPCMREKFLEAIKAEGIDEASRNEAGNLKYDYYFAEADCDELLLVENWADEEALRIHHDEPHFKRLSELKEGFVKETIKEEYKI